MLPTIDDAHAFVKALDLDKFLERATQVDLEMKDIVLAERTYRHFLMIAWIREFKCRDGTTDYRPIVPTRLADEVWHAHIIHTRNYRSMCITLLGKYLDHEPDPTKKTSADTGNLHYTTYLDDAIPSHLRFLAQPFIKKEKETSGSSCGGPCNSCGD